MTCSRTRRAAALTAALTLAATTALASGLGTGAAASPAGWPDPAWPGTPPALADPAAPGRPAVSLKKASTGAGADAGPGTPDAEAATDALATAQELLTPLPAAAARAALADGGVEVTMALRDLAARADALPSADRADADALLSRPTGASDGNDFTVEYGIPEAAPACTRDLCVHYVTGANANGDAPPLTDLRDAAGAAGANGVPDYVDTVLRVMTDVHDRYRTAGYREPLPDRGRGGDDRIDIYLAEIGNRGAYGYCTTDQPNATDGPKVYDRWAYCVLDDDYAGFPSTQLKNIQVTAAHEYFHATQYAYDAFEDAWLLEATAAWVEDEVYDDVNDNVQYLRRSPLTSPFVPLDAFVTGGDYANFHYGTWSFIRFLTERFPARKGGIPQLVLDVMKRVDGSRGGRDEYSWQAVESVLKQKRTSAAKQFLAYSVANRSPGRTYDEGKAQKYPTGPLRGRVTLTRKTSRTRTATVTTDHLTSATYRITPKKLRKRGTRLKVSLDMAPRRNGSMAAVAVVPATGRTKVYGVKLDGRGDGTRVVPFSSRTVKYVEVTLANAGNKTDCFQDLASPFSCYGVPKHDRQEQRLRASVVR